MSSFYIENLRCMIIRLYVTRLRLILQSKIINSIILVIWKQHESHFNLCLQSLKSSKMSLCLLTNLILNYIKLSEIFIDLKKSSYKSISINLGCSVYLNVLYVNTQLMLCEAGSVVLYSSCTSCGKPHRCFSMLMPYLKTSH